MFVSYAQFLEDVLLNRALREVQNGFYIDVGANDPIVDSVTKQFYENGWSGINVEPSPHWFAKVIADRPRDINLNLAVSDSVGSFEFHEIEGSGLSTLVPEIAGRHKLRGLGSVTYQVESDTLKNICDKHAPSTIHFLKVDVEGAERSVLAGADFKAHRPWIILVEATEPMSEVPSYEDWDPLLVTADYEFVLFDGINRFYIAKEKPELKPFFYFRADQYQKATAIWTEGHWRRIAEEREAQLQRIKSSPWWKIGAKAARIARKFRS